MNNYEYEITLNDNVMTFIRDHGECYGGKNRTQIDTEGKTGRSLRLHLTKHLGKRMSKAAAEQGFCE